ncbi:MAG: flagellar biosynthetic protein FliO [Nitrospira sp.]|nr:flagellar biosynthetic protein FliO [Nitrospira sp.]
MIDFWDSLLRTLSALAVVLVLMAAAASIARRLIGKRPATAERRGLVRVVASEPIAPRKTIAVVAVGGDYLIVGATATELVPLGRVSDAEKVRELLASEENVTSSSIPPSRLAAWLRRPALASWFGHRERHGER